ncbi:hypothetical protein F511_20636 [Dorcoceras hygrometricum]|uniref:Uncharacterized protein n=1 Tax=Dorcoceras hygrometricum TaxID=472368 RepID=A0A2Z7A7W4_9LAMI|nr:hypothetical protein F511_20636 [Dorcoceras hygrometricum]
MIEEQAQEHITIEDLPPVVHLVEEAEAVVLKRKRLENRCNMLQRQGKKALSHPVQQSQVFPFILPIQLVIMRNVRFLVLSVYNLYSTQSKELIQKKNKILPKLVDSPSTFQVPRQILMLYLNLSELFYKKMDEVVTSVNTSQTALETNLVRQFTESQQHFASQMALVKLQLAELVNHLKEISDTKKGEGESSKKRWLL